MNVILRDGQMVGQMTDAGLVQSGLGTVGKVDAAGIVYDRDGSYVGTADLTGLLFAASGDMAGHMDPEGYVWAGDLLLGQVAGPLSTRAAGALRFLFLEPSPAVISQYRAIAPPLPSTLPSSTETQIIPISRASGSSKVARTPGKGSGRLPFFGFAALLSLGLLVVWNAAAGKRAAERYSSSSSAPQASVQTSGESSLSTLSVPSVREQLAARYQEMDAAYGRKDAASYYNYHDASWTFQNRDGSRSDLAEARNYFAMRFSPSHKSRFLTCSLSEQIESLTARNDAATVVVAQTALTRTRQRRARTNIRQEDTWQNQSGTWRCVRSRLLSVKVTVL